MSEAPITIRFATADDAPVIHRFICQLAEYEREPDAVEVMPDELREQMASDPPPFECLIAKLGDKPVGFALFFHNYSTWRGRRGLYIEDLFVPPEHRRLGFGRKLLVELARIARKRDCARVEWSVLKWNEMALSFYRKLGAVPMDEWVTFRLTDDPLASLSNENNSE